MDQVDLVDPIFKLPELIMFNCGDTHPIIDGAGGHWGLSIVIS